TVRSNKKFDVDLADTLRRCARFRIIGAGVAGDFGLRARFVSRTNATGRRALAMDRSLARVARIYFAVLDCELGGFFDTLSSAQRDRISERSRRARGVGRGIPVATANAAAPIEVGAHLTFRSRRALH